MTTTAPLAAPDVDLRAWIAPVAAAAVVGSVLAITPLFYGGWPQIQIWMLPRLVTLAAAASVVVGVLLARRSPALATLLTVAPWIIVPFVGWFVWGWWLGTCAVAVLAALDGIRRAVLPFLVAAAIVVAYGGYGLYALLPGYLESVGPVTAGGVVVYLVVMAAAVGISAAIGASRRSRARHTGAQVAEQHALEVESLASERARLARDLHDVVAHHVSLVAVRAESAPFLHPGLDDDARAVLADIAQDAREALTELRQVLVVLQRTSDEGERAPQPTACDVDALVAGAVAAGQQITVDGSWQGVAAGTGYVLFRAVQEGLTNARRHAPGGTTSLLRTQSDDAVGFRMSNPTERDGEPGRGLIGMRERVEALGGTMTAVVVDGEFVLEIEVPA